jgi:YD repeat-containing protein
MFMLAARVLLLWAVLASSVCAAINPHPDVASVTDSRGGKTLTYRYSPGGLLNYKQDGDGNRTDYLYDAVGRLTGIWLPNFDYVAYSHDRTGRRVQKWQSEGGIDTYYAWNADGSLAGLTNYANATALTSHSYGYDAFGRKASATEYFNPYPIAWSYGHDALDRLTEVRYAFNGGAQTLLGAYRYDPRGNRTRSTASNGSYRASVLDGGQRLARLDDYSSAGALLGTVAQFQYDANGDLTQKQAAAGSLALSWDPEGHLATAASTGTGAVSQSYLYDDQGRRIRKTSGASTTHYLYDGADIHAEYATWATPQAVYAHGAGTDEPIAKLAGATDEPGADARYYHADGQGSITAQTQGGTLYGWVMQDPWGVIQISLGSGAPKYGYSYQGPGAGRDRAGVLPQPLLRPALGGHRGEPLRVPGPLGPGGGHEPLCRLRQRPGGLRRPGRADAPGRQPVRRLRFLLGAGRLLAFDDLQWEDESGHHQQFAGQCLQRHPGGPGGERHDRRPGHHPLRRAKQRQSAHRLHQQPAQDRAGHGLRVHGGWAGVEGGDSPGRRGGGGVEKYSERCHLSVSENLVLRGSI